MRNEVQHIERAATSRGSVHGPSWLSSKNVKSFTQSSRTNINSLHDYRIYHDSRNVIASDQLTTTQQQSQNQHVIIMHWTVQCCHKVCVTLAWCTSTSTPKSSNYVPFSTFTPSSPPIMKATK